MPYLCLVIAKTMNKERGTGMIDGSRVQELGRYVMNHSCSSLF